MKNIKLDDHDNKYKDEKSMIKEVKGTKWKEWLTDDEVYEGVGCVEVLLHKINYIRKKR